MNPTRIWDLPTRLFHWALAACVIALVITAKVGGDAMNFQCIDCRAFSADDAPVCR